MNRIFLLFSFFLLGGCNRSAETLYDSQFDENAPGDSLHAVRIPVDGEFLDGYPLLAFGDRIVMSNPMQLDKNFSVYLFTGDSLKKEGEFLSRGRGPYEAVHADISYDTNTRQLNMLSNANRENRFSRVRVDKPGDLYDMSKWEYRPLPFIGKNSLGESCLVGGSVFLTLGCHTDSLNMFSMLDIDKEQVTPLDFRYPEIPIQLSPFFQGFYWEGKLFKCPHRNRFLYSAQGFKYLFIFDLDKENRLNLVRYICDVLPKTNLSATSNIPYSFDDACEDGFYPIAVDDKHIYVGYTQTTYGQLRNLARAGKTIGSVTSPRRINVYDWDGNFVRRLILDKAIGPMVITENQIVAVHTDPETAEECFVRYAL